jgi:putative acetyltransferase
MRIRQAAAQDRAAIQAVQLAVFSGEEAAHVAGLAAALLLEASVPATLSLVAEDSGVIVAHAVFSPTYRAENGQHLGYVLAPVGVLPGRQKTGLGSQLIRSGLEQLRARGAGLVFVYGDPAYYGRFGFNARNAARFVPPYSLDEYPFGWPAMALAEPPAGQGRIGLRCVEALSDPALW